MIHPVPSDIQAPAIYYCDMSRQLMRDPVISVYGYTFERRAITNWLLVLGNNFCPCSGKDMTINDLVFARNFKEEINMWRAEHGLPSDSTIIGMTLIITPGDKNEQGERSQHENNENDDFSWFDHKDEEGIVIPDRSEYMDPEVFRKKEQEGCNDDHRKEDSSTRCTSSRGQTRVVRPLVHLLRRKVFPVQPAQSTASS